MSPEEIKEIAESYPEPEGRISAVLEEIQRRCRYLPEEALRIASGVLGVPLSRLYGVATFYAAFTLQPRGKHLISVCHGTACHVKGAKNLTERFEKELEIREGQTTADGMFTLEAVRCLGCCSLAPVFSIDGRVYSGVRPEQIPELLEAWKRGWSGEGKG